MTQKLSNQNQTTKRYTVGEKIMVRWPEDGTYYEATVKTVSPPEIVLEIEWTDEPGYKQKVPVSEVRSW